MDSDIFDDLFHGCAFQAYLDEARETHGWPDCEATRRRAYRYYEEALAERNRAMLTKCARESSDEATHDDGDKSLRSCYPHKTDH